MEYEPSQSVGITYGNTEMYLDFTLFESEINLQLFQIFILIPRSSLKWHRQLH